MTATGKTPLELVRAACADVRGQLTGDSALLLERADTILARLIAEERGLDALRARVEPRLKALAGADAPAGFQQIAAAVQRRIGTYPAVDDRFLLDAVAADAEFWAGYREMVLAVVKEPAGSAPDPDAQETFNADALAAFLRREFPGEDAVEVVSANVASRGFSKKTLLVELRGNRTLPADIVLRVDQPFNYLGTTVLDEYGALRHMFAHGVCVPEPLALEASGSVIGMPFIVFRKVPGAPIGNNYTPPARNPAQVAELAAHLARLHAAPWAGVKPSRGGENVRQNLDDEIDKYERDWRECGAVCPIVEAGLAWIKRNRALGDGPPALVHNDYNYNNILIHEGHVSAIVDWEFIYIGTAAADISYFHYSAEAVDSFDNFLAAYAAGGGTVPPRATLDFYILWGQLRLAIMGFQVDQSFRAGKFDDARFGITGALFGPIAQKRVADKLVELLRNA